MQSCLCLEGFAFGHTRQMETGMKRFGHAVVIGGGVAGLLAARTLSEHFERVTLLERDELPESPVFRKGVPQSHHLHILLIRGQQILDGLFPGFSEDLRQAGAVQIDIGREFLFITPFGQMRNGALGLHVLAASRVLVEWYIRRRVREIPGVSLRGRAAVEQLVLDGAKRRVRGVLLRAANRASAGETVAADLVVDASGRNTNLPAWLGGYGYPAVRSTIVNSHLAYATRWYRAPQGIENGWKGIVVNVSPPDNPRGAAVMPVEGGRWVVTLGGMAGVVPPTDADGFLEFTRQLSSPVVYETIRSWEPLSRVYGYRKAFNEWKHFEQMPRFPAGLAAIGDAVCAFNPIYGQGMTIAAMSAVELGNSLAGLNGTGIPDDFGLRFHKRLARLYKVPWQLATGEDFRWEQTEGERPGLGVRIGHWYTDQVAKAAGESLTAAQAFIEVVHLLKPPSELMKPGVLVPALRQGLFSALAFRGRPSANGR